MYSLERMGPARFRALALAWGRGALALVLGAFACTWSQAQGAEATEVMSIKEDVHLHLMGYRGPELVEQGEGSGTFNCPVRILLKVAATITTHFMIHPSGGSITGRGEAHTHSGGSHYVSFSGRLVVKGGSGRYANATGNDALYGVIDRANDSLTVQVVGRLRT